MKQSAWAAVPCLVALAFLFTLKAAAQVQTARYSVNVSSKCKGYYEYLPQGYDPNTTTTYPLLVFFSGIGEFGNGGTSTTSGLPKILKNGTPKQIAAGIFPKSFSVLGQTFRFIVVSPQFLVGSNPSAADVDTVLQYMLAHYKVNTKRVYLTGLSYGAGLCLAYAGNRNTNYGKRVAAIVPTASPLPLPTQTGYDTIYARSRIIAAANIPVWATHNKGDRYPDSSLNTITYVNDINLSPAPNPSAKMTIFNLSGHNSWDTTYSLNFRSAGYTVYEWMLLYQKGGTVPAANQPPTANAGADKTITLPTNSVSITATGTDPEGGALTYSWTQLYGPAKATISAPSPGATATFSALAQGYYAFRVTSGDNKGAKATDDVKVTVNAAPVSGQKYINVNLYGSSTSGKYNNTAWNNWQVLSTTLTSAVFKYSDATTSTVNAVLSATSTVSDNSTYYGGGMAPPEVLRFTSPASAARTLTLNGLSTAKTYTLELYASRNVTTSNNNTVFTINGTSVTINVNNNITQRAKFANLKANSFGQIVVNIGQTGTANYLNGFILTESTTTASVTRQMVTDRSEFVDANGVQVFPNPASSSVQLHVQNDFKGAVQVRLANANGRVQQEWRFEKDAATLQQTLSVAGLPAGEYFVTVQMGSKQQTLRLTKLN